MDPVPRPPVFRVERYDVPGTWENYLSNDEYCVVMTPSGRGLSYWRYLPFFQTSTGGRHVYLRDLASGALWGVAQEPPHSGAAALHEEIHPLVLTQDVRTASSQPPFPLPAAPEGFASFRCEHGAGWTRIESEFAAIRAWLLVTVPPGASGASEIWEIGVENRGAALRELAVMPTLGLTLGGGAAMLGNFPTFNRVRWDPEEHAFHAANLGIRYHGLPNLHACFAAGTAPDGACSTVDAGARALRTGQAAGAADAGEPLQLLLLYRASLAPGERRAWSLALAAGDDPAAAGQRARAAARRGTAAVLGELDAWWSEHQSHFQAELPDAEYAEFVNGWLQVELVQCARWTRGGGERGYRDLLQDAWAVAAFDPGRARAMIAEAAAHQYPCGWAPRSYPPPPFSRCPLNGRLSADSGAWLPLALSGYVRETGDLSLLHEEAGFLQAPLPPLVAAATANRPGVPAGSAPASLLEHAARAVRHLHAARGARGLPLLLGGDWNDGLDDAGLGGRGESVWLGMCLALAAEELASLAGLAGSGELDEEARGISAAARRAVEEHGWDGDWYRQGFADDGRVIGGRESREGRLHLLPQAWAILAGFGDGDRRSRLLAAVDRDLETPLGPKLLHPPYVTRDATLGRVTARVPGTSDNAGVQTHAAVMMAAARLAAGQGDAGFAALRAVTPMNPARRRETTATPPFVLNSQTIGPDNPRFGAVEIGWLTGAAGWMTRATGELLLGARPEFGGLRIEPCIPTRWESARLRRRFRGALYDIRLCNPAGREGGVASIVQDGRRLSGTLLASAAPGTVTRVEVILGQVDT